MASILKNLSDFSHTVIPSGKGLQIGVIVSEWNSAITSALYKGTIDTLIKNGVEASMITSASVPGTFELSVAAEMMLRKNAHLDAIICLGCVIQGETKHFDFICQAVANGITQVSIQHQKPVVFGVLTTNTLAQAQDRSGGKHGNKGDEAAITALKMAYFTKECE